VVEPHHSKLSPAVTTPGVCALVQILGFDILLKSDGMPVLLEVNASPSMRLDYEQQVSSGVVEVVKSPVDEEIKKALVLDTLLLVAPRIRTRSSRASSTAFTRSTASARYRQRPFVFEFHFYTPLSLSSAFERSVNIEITLHRTVLVWRLHAYL